MPVLGIRALPQKAGVDIKAAMKKTCLAVAAAANLDKRHVWATWETLEPGFYIEGNSAAKIQPHDTHPPIVNLIVFEGRPDDIIEAMILAASDTLAKELQIERGNIFLTCTEVKSGRVFTGGEIRCGHL